MPDRLERRHSRERAEESFAGKLRAAITSSGLDVKRVASVLMLGKKGCEETARRALYRVLDGERGLNAGALWALPVPVRRLVAEDLAASCGLETRPVSEHTAAAATTAIAECADVVRVTAEALADGQLDTQEAARLRSEIAEAQESLAALDARCREVLDSRRVVAIGGGK